jgi:signal transduction histidine kinase/FixJ family two-component response regulator
MYQMREQISNQKQNLQYINQQFALTNTIIYEIQEAQNAAHLLKYQNKSKQNKELDYFNATIKHIEVLIDSLSTFTGDSTQTALLSEVHTLLLQKQKITGQLAALFSNTNQIDNLTQQLEDVPSIISKSDSIVVSQTMVPQQITQSTEVVKKGLFSKRTETQLDTIIVYRTQIDTMVYSTTDTSGVETVRNISRQVGKDIEKRLKDIEKQVIKLSISEQEITKQISSLLTKLHKNTLDSLFNEIQKSEQSQKRNYTTSILAVLAAMILVLVFVLLIRNYVNKGFAARKALADAKQHTEDIMQSRHSLLLSVSHDIKAPLSSIIAYLDLLQTDSLAIDQQQQIHSMQNSAKHILALLSNVLDFSRLEQGKIELNASNFDIVQSCKEICDMFMPIAGQKKLAFSSEIVFKSPTYIYADQLKIKQILVNILSNAFKYTPSGSIDFCIENAENMLLVRVTDTGVGIPNDKLTLLGKQFSRISENNNCADGAGLGLFVVNGLLKLLNGSMNIESEVGKGTTISLHIPYKPVTENEEMLHHTESYTCCKQQHILIIDDDTNLLAVLQKMLEKLGHSTTLCHSLEEFNAALHEHSADFSCIITDMEMGSIKGTYILERSKHEVPHIPVIIMTAHSEYTMEQAKHEGFTAFLSKPFSLQSLNHVLCSIFPHNEEVITNNTISSFTSLYEMFDGDEEAIQSVLQNFIDSTKENITLLRQAYDNNDFAIAQQLCHKMLPMFLQVELYTCTDFLSKMDTLKQGSAHDFPEWREELLAFIEHATQEINVLSMRLQA